MTYEIVERSLVPSDAFRLEVQVDSWLLVLS